MHEDNATAVDEKSPAEPLSADALQQLRDGLMILQGLAIASLMGRRKGMDAELRDDIANMTQMLAAQQPKSEIAPPT